MTSQERDFIQRRSFRCGLPAGQQQALLEAARRQLPVRLLNESVEGAAVWTDQNAGVNVDDVVWLSTSFGRFEARVVHVTQIEPPASDGSRGSPGFHLGLEWLRELAAPPAVQPALPETRRSPPLRAAEDI